MLVLGELVPTPGAHSMHFVAGLPLARLDVYTA